MPAEKLMLVSCHPDDELLSSCVLLLTAKRQGIPTTLLWATKGERSVSRQAHSRTIEAATVARAISAQHDFLGLPDGAVNRSDAIGAVQRAIESIGPTLVVWPFGVGPEQHQDHRALHEALINIANRSSYSERVFLAGQPPVLDDRHFSPSLFIGYDEGMMNEAQDLLQLYLSEQRKGFFRQNDVEPRASHWARQARLVSPYAEPYELVRGVPPMALFPRRYALAHESVQRYIEHLEDSAQDAALDLIRLLREQGHLAGYSWQLDEQLWCISQRHGEDFLTVIYAPTGDVLLLLEGFSSPRNDVPAARRAAARDRLVAYLANNRFTA